jgi:hypothetical protein
MYKVILTILYSEWLNSGKLLFESTPKFKYQEFKFGSEIGCAEVFELRSA